MLACVCLRACAQDQALVLPESQRLKLGKSVMFGSAQFNFTVLPAASHRAEVPTRSQRVCVRALVFVFYCHSLS